ncbi:MAG: conjugal transfer protein TraO [Prevotellaceae bacterium]|nr:conjugal transfer protein TraO [Prevotellaceae bacterium]
MMKNLYFILTFALCFFVSDMAHAQRYLHGQYGLQFTAGIINGGSIDTKSNDFAFHAGMAFSGYAKNGNRWMLGGEYLEKRYLYEKITIPQVQFTAESGYFFKLLSDGAKTFFLSLGASALGGYEIINWGEKLLYDGSEIQYKDAFLYGAALTLETETYLVDFIVLLINIKEKLVFGSSMRKFNTQLGLGLKFIIN